VAKGAKYPTLILAMVKRGGLWKANKAVGYIVAWGICRDALGHDPSWNEYMDYWGQSRSTTARESGAFFACVPEGVRMADVWATLDGVDLSAGRDVVAAQVMSSPWMLS